MRLPLIPAVLMAGLLAALSVRAQISVWTHHNDNLRTGANLSETQLTTANVNVNSFGKLFSYSVDGSIYAQPLYIPAVSIPGKGTHNVIYVATMNDSVYAFDADSNTGGMPLWTVNFTNPAGSITAVSASEIEHAEMVSGPIGIMGTPVIDQATGTLYAVARTKEKGLYMQRLHALDISTGVEKFGGPVVVQASVSGTGYDSVDGVLQFNPTTANQRGALVLLNGMVAIAWGGLDDDFDPYHGWVMTYDAATLRQLAVFNTTVNGSRGGIWQSGNGAPADPSGNLYYTTGNGTWDGSKNLGDSVLKLNPARGLSLSDSFTPDNQQYLEDNDLDLGVGGLLLIPGTNLLLSGSKQGLVYLLTTQNMGHQQSGNGQIRQIVQATTGHIHGGPVYYDSPGLGPLIYIWGANDRLKAFHFNSTTLDTAPVMQGRMPAPVGVPGGILSLSANGNQAGTAILWASTPVSQDSEMQVVPGVLRAFDANDLTNELWESLQNPARDDVGNFGKFCPPTIANGKVYLATFSNSLNVYGLLPRFMVSTTPSVQTPLQGASATYAVSTSAQNGFSGSVGFTVSGLPAGAAGAFNPSVVSGGASSTLTINTASNTAPGSYTLTITGASASLSHSAVVTLQVNIAGGHLRLHHTGGG